MIGLNRHWHSVVWREGEKPLVVHYAGCSFCSPPTDKLTEKQARSPASRSVWSARLMLREKCSFGFRRTSRLSVHDSDRVGICLVFSHLVQAQHSVCCHGVPATDRRLYLPLTLTLTLTLPLCRSAHATWSSCAPTRCLSASSCATSRPAGRLAPATTTALQRCCQSQCRCVFSCPGTRGSTVSIAILSMSLISIQAITTKTGVNQSAGRQCVDRAGLAGCRW